MIGKRTVKNVLGMINKFPQSMKSVWKHPITQSLPTIGKVGAAAGLFAATKGAPRVYESMEQSSIINPIFLGKRATQGYGKRGLDANNQQTDGLVQSLYKGRRAQR